MSVVAPARDARQDVARDPMETLARVRAVCLGPGGIPKLPVDEAFAGELGLEGDAHRFRLHGGPRRAVLLFSVEDYQRLASDGVVAAMPGAYGENLLTEGLDLAALVPGERLAVGDELVLEVDAVRAPCKTLRSIDPRFPALMIGRSGRLCAVLRPGHVRAGLPIRRLPAAAAGAR